MCLAPLLGQLFKNHATEDYLEVKYKPIAKSAGFFLNLVMMERDWLWSNVAWWFVLLYNDTFKPNLKSSYGV